MNSISRRVLVVLSTVDHLDAWLSVAQRLCGASGTILLRGLVTIPQGTSLSEGAIQAREMRHTLDRRAQAETIIADEVRVHVDYQPMTSIIGEIAQRGVDLALIEWHGPDQMIGGMHTDEVLQQCQSDIVLIGGEGWWESGSVLLALRGGPNLSLGVEVARALANSHNITLFHAADQMREMQDPRLLLEHEPSINRAVTASYGIMEGMLRELRDHKAAVLGATYRLPEASASALGPLVNRIYRESSTPIVLVRAAHPEAMTFHAPYSTTVKAADLSTRVDRWFAEATFHSEEFSDLHHLLAMKEKQGLSISVGLPALNEEETVEHVIRTLKTALMDDVPLVDEIVLIDSDSTDRTREIAEQCGIPVYIHQQVLTEDVGALRGKGEALWKSLHVLRGDLIAWVDTDITNIHPRFIYGLLGPMLRHPHIHYVKGFYQRPIRVGEKVQATGGGRVTELVARPLLNLFYPELSGVIQPLSGEYAGRRSLLERVPFFSGYGVETGLLIDILKEVGLEGIAQTDLEMRVHHNQTLTDLSKMAFAIIQVFIARLEGRYGLELLEKTNRTMKTIIHEPGRFALAINDIGDVERPPIVSLAAYRTLRSSVAR